MVNTKYNVVLIFRQNSGDETYQVGGGGSSESDNDYISQDDRRRIMETERLLTESEEIGGDRLPEPGAGAVRRHPGPHHSRRRRKLPEIPKDKKRKTVRV